MKRIIDWTIIGLACVVLIWGITAASISLANSNNTRIATYAKDGRSIVRTDVAEGNEYLQVKSLEYEIIRNLEYYSRLVKHNKIVMDKAKENYDADNTNENLLDEYNEAKANYEEAKSDKSYYGRLYFTSSSSVFFGTYFPIIIFLGIAILVNQKVEYKKKEKKA